jgi:hypothetical protein
LESYLERVLIDLLEVKGNNNKDKDKDKDKEKDKDKDVDDTVESAPPPTLSTSSSSSSFANSFPSFQKPSPSPLESANQSSSSSTHGLNGIHGIHGITSNSTGNEESYAVRLANLLTVPTCITERGNDSRSFFALNEKIIAAESCHFAVSVSTHAHTHAHLLSHF